MLRSYASQNNTFKRNGFTPFFPGRYIYLDRYFEKIFQRNNPLSITISLFDGRVSVFITTEGRKIIIKGDKGLSEEVSRHLYQLEVTRTYSIEIVK